jgi:hypothetical protein
MTEVNGILIRTGRDFLCCDSQQFRTFTNFCAKTRKTGRGQESRMGQPQARKSTKHKNGNHPLHRTRNYGRDVDQIHGDLAEKAKTLLKNTELDEEKPGLGKWYCVECAKWFIDEQVLEKHKTTKVHKRRYVLAI